MLQADNLSKGFGGEIILNGISFSIQKGERCGLVGRNGSGKTTLFKIITGEETADKGTISSPKNYSIGYLNQHIKFTMPTILEEGALGLPESDKDSLYNVENILVGIGFKEEQFYDSPSTLSGGYHLRLHLAKVLLSEPDCLLLDEPTNYLDITSIKWLEKTLKQWRGEFVLISHDREFMDSVTTHTMGIHRQKMKKIKGSTVDFYTQVVAEEEIHEKTRIKIERKKSHAQSFIDRFGAKASKAAQAQSRVKLLSRIPTLEKLMEIYQLEFDFKEAYFPGKKMLEAEELSFSYNPEERELIKEVSLAIEKGERLAIIGKNGRGKSTLLKLIAGELEAQSGTIKRSENLKIGYFGQTNIDRLHPKMTIEEEISVANSQLTFTEARGICGLMMFSGDKAKKPISVLSGGEKSRVLLGKILATPCNLLLLDEPTHHLDMESIEALIDALEEFEGAVIIVTHSELILKRMYLDKIIVCRQDSQELFLGTYEDFLEKDGWNEEKEPKKAKKSNSDRKENKQKRTEIITMRSKILKEIEAEIAQHEKKAETLEKAQQEANAVLAAGKPSPDILKRISEKQKEIDRLYAKMEQLHAKHQEQSAHFAKLLDEA